MAHHRCRYFMKRLWLLFSQAGTVFVAAYFVVATLQPEWLGRGGTRSPAGVALLLAPGSAGGQAADGGLRAAAPPGGAVRAGRAESAGGGGRPRRARSRGPAASAGRPTGRRQRGQHQYQQGSAE